jgi:hypothetical protein
MSMLDDSPEQTMQLGCGESKFESAAMAASFLTAAERIVTEPDSIMTSNFANATTIFGYRDKVAIKRRAALWG